jgi:adenylate cyclase
LWGTPIKRKLAAILAADVAGYSRLMAADEERTHRLLAAHRAIVDSIIATVDRRPRRGRPSRVAATWPLEGYLAAHLAGAHAADVRARIAELLARARQDVEAQRDATERAGA